MRSRGFSLVELMVAVVVIGLVLGFSLPAFGTYRKSMLRRQVREQITQDLRIARQAAITQHAPIIVAFGNGVATTDITTYTVHTDKNADGVKQGTEPRTLHTLPKDTKLTQIALAPVDTLRFDISGVLRPGTNGGRLVYATGAGAPETLVVSVAGLVYRP